MSKKTAKFVTKLSQDPELAKQFQDDPEAAMEGEDLDDEDREVLKTQDEAKIREHCGDDDPPGCLVFI